ncbi:MAG: hypothetical protein M5U28_13530 [Sandaracinaceae bacterium]|nr:hypothetical protein [Sandaracinaceae bacterium]
MRFGNVRKMGPEQLACADEHDFQVVVDYPFDDPGFGPNDDEQVILDFEEKTGGTWTVSWLPSFFSREVNELLGDLVVLEHILDGKENRRTYLSHLRVEDRERAELDLENLRSQKRQRVFQAIEQAYGMRNDRPGDLDPAASVDEHLRLLKPGAQLLRRQAATLADTLSAVIDALLDARYPRHPKLSRKLSPQFVESMVERFGALVDSDDKRIPADRTLASEMGGTLGELGLVRATENAVLLMPDRTLQRIEQARVREHADRPTVAEVRRWIDENGAMGLTPLAMDLVVRCYARAEARTFVLHGKAFTPEAKRAPMPDEVELDKPDLPALSAWNAALGLAGTLFGIALPSRALHGDNLKRLETALLEKLGAVSGPARRLPDRLRRRLEQRGVATDAPRLATAESGRAMCEALEGLRGRQLVEVLATFEAKNSPSALSRQLAQAANALALLDDDLVFGPFAQLEGRAASIEGASELLASVDRALAQDEILAPSPSCAPSRTARSRSSRASIRRRRRLLCPARSSSSTSASRPSGPGALDRLERLLAEVRAALEAPATRACEARCESPRRARRSGPCAASMEPPGSSGRSAPAKRPPPLAGRVGVGDDQRSSYFRRPPRPPPASGRGDRATILCASRQPGDREERMTEPPRLSERDVSARLEKHYRQPHSRHLFAFYGSGADSMIDVSGAGRFAIVPVESELDLRDKLTSYEAPDARVVFLVPWSTEVPLDVSGRFAGNGKVLRVGVEARLRRMFGVAEVSDEACRAPLARYLLATDPDASFRSVEGRLTERALWSAWLRDRWGLEALALDALLGFAARDGRGGAFVAAMQPAPEVREGLLALFDRELGPAGRAIWTAWERGRGEVALGYAVLCEELAKTSDPSAAVWLRLEAQAGARRRRRAGGRDGPLGRRARRARLRVAARAGARAREAPRRGRRARGRGGGARRAVRAPAAAERVARAARRGRARAARGRRGALARGARAGERGAERARVARALPRERGDHAREARGDGGAPARVPRRSHRSPDGGAGHAARRRGRARRVVRGRGRLPGLGPRLRARLRAGRARARRLGRRGRRRRGARRARRALRERALGVDRGRPAVERGRADRRGARARRRAVPEGRSRSAPARPLARRDGVGAGGRAALVDGRARDGLGAAGLARERGGPHRQRAGAARLRGAADDHRGEPGRLLRRQAHGGRRGDQHPEGPRALRGAPRAARAVRGAAAPPPARGGAHGGRCRVAGGAHARRRCPPSRRRHRRQRDRRVAQGGPAAARPMGRRQHPAARGPARGRAAGGPGDPLRERPRARAGP